MSATSSHSPFRFTPETTGLATRPYHPGRAQTSAVAATATTPYPGFQCLPVFILSLLCLIPSIPFRPSFFRNRDLRIQFSSWSALFISPVITSTRPLQLLAFPLYQFAGEEASKQAGKKMKFTALVLSLCASLAAAGVVITPIRPEQVVEKSSDDCFFGVTTPQGCGYVWQFSLFVCGSV